MEDSGGERKLRLMTYIVPGLPLGVYQACQYHLEESLGRDTLLLVESRWSCPPRHLPDPFMADEADVVFMCCPGYLRLASENNPFMELCPAAPLFEHAQNPDGRPVYFTDVIVLDDVRKGCDATIPDKTDKQGSSEDNTHVGQINGISNGCEHKTDHGYMYRATCNGKVNHIPPITKHGDAIMDHVGESCEMEKDGFLSLRGRRWAVNDCESLSGHLSTLVELKRRGLGLDFFSNVVFSGGHHK